jgi:hypothetical protein
MVLERYLQTLLALSLRDRTAICAFFNSDIVPDAVQPSTTGAMAGWLTKRGRNFGGWQVSSLKSLDSLREIQQLTSSARRLATTFLLPALRSPTTIR